MIGLDFRVDVKDPGKVIPEEELPFEALDINNFVLEEDLESVRTGQLDWRGFLPGLELTAAQWTLGL